MKLYCVTFAKADEPARCYLFLCEDVSRFDIEDIAHLFVYKLSYEGDMSFSLGEVANKPKESVDRYPVLK